MVDGATRLEVGGDRGDPDTVDSSSFRGLSATPRGLR